MLTRDSYLTYSVNDFSVSKTCRDYWNNLHFVIKECIS